MPRTNKRPRSRSYQHTDRAFSSVSILGTPGPFTDEELRVLQAESFVGLSPSSVAKLSDYRRQLFMGPPTTHTASKNMEGTSNLMVTPGSSQEQVPSQDQLDHDVLPLDNLASEENINQEPQDATPRRNPQRSNQQQQRQQPERPDLKDVLTQLTQEILTMRREVATTTYRRTPTSPGWCLNLYTIVATYGWPTAIASSSAVQAVPSNYLLPPGVQPVQQNQQ